MQTLFVAQQYDSCNPAVFQCRLANLSGVNSRHKQEGYEMTHPDRLSLAATSILVLLS